jgi:hypothetical protein
MYTHTHSHNTINYILPLLTLRRRNHILRLISCTFLFKKLVTCFTIEKNANSLNMNQFVRLFNCHHITCNEKKNSTHIKVRQVKAVKKVS